MLSIMERSAPSRNSLDSVLQINPFGFESQTSFDATQTLLTHRSDSFIQRSPPKDNDIWKRPPPDFRIQVYEPRPPKRSSKESMQPWRYADISKSTEIDTNQPVEKIENLESALPTVLRPRRPPSPKIVTTGFNIPGSYDARILYVQNGMYKPGMYQSPKPHDFRGYSPIHTLGLPEFETRHERDPSNIKFRSQRINTIYNMKQPNLRDVSGRQMSKPATPKLMWDPQLILPKGPWPTKSMETTRHRRKNRSIRSAVMDRVEEKLTAQWAKEKLEKELEKQKMKYENAILSRRF